MAMLRVVAGWGISIVVRSVLAVCLAAMPAFAAQLTRGPFLQLATPTEITVVFRTDTPGLGRIRFGTQPASLPDSIQETAPTTEHVIRLTGLTPSTRYWYAVDLDGTPLAANDDLRFRTYPVPGTAEPFRLFAWGDSGTATEGQLRVARQMSTQVGDATLALILGDIIYPDGRPADYDPKFFQPYASLLRRLVIWPVIGNHDVYFDSKGTPYLDAFALPANNPQRTELYYSFDYGNAHFVMLDTHVSSFAPASPQMRWAADDLKNSTATWKFAAFHVPPFSGGTHADNRAVQEGIVPILEAAGVDVVFAGHSHVYERTHLLKNRTVVQSHPTTYLKPQRETGTLYLVSGTAGQSGSLSNGKHPLMAFQRGNTLGTSVVDVAGNTLHGYFLQDDGSAIDVFRLTRGEKDTQPPGLIGARATTPTRIELSFNEPVQAATVERPRAWRIVPDVPVLSAHLASDLRTVTLTTVSAGPGEYAIAASGVVDLAATPNAVRPDDWRRYRVAGDDARASGPRPPWRFHRDADATLPPTPRTWSDAMFSADGWRTGRGPLGYAEQLRR